MTRASQFSPRLRRSEKISSPAHSGITHHIDEGFPLMLFDAAEVNPTVFALHRFERLNRLLAQAGGDHLHVGPILESEFELRGDRFLAGDIDVLAFAVAHLRHHGTHRRDCAMHPALVSALQAEGLERRQLGMIGAGTIEDADAACGPDRELFGAQIPPWAGDAVGRDRGHHEARVDRVQALEIESNAIHLGRRDVVNEDVGLRDELFEQIETLGPCDIERDAELVGIEVEEQTALFGMRLAAGKRTAHARMVANAGPFDLDDFGAHIGHQLRRIRRRRHLTDFDDFEAR